MHDKIGSSEERGSEIMNYDHGSREVAFPREVKSPTIEMSGIGREEKYCSKLATVLNNSSRRRIPTSLSKTQPPRPAPWPATPRLTFGGRAAADSGAEVRNGAIIKHNQSRKAKQKDAQQTSGECNGTEAFFSLLHGTAMFMNVVPTARSQFSHVHQRVEQEITRKCESGRGGDWVPQALKNPKLRLLAEAGLGRYRSAAMDRGIEKGQGTFLHLLHSCAGMEPTHTQTYRFAYYSAVVLESAKRKWLSWNRCCWASWSEIVAMFVGWVEKVGAIN